MAFPARRIMFPIALDDRWNREALTRYMESIRDKAVYLPSNIEYLARNNGIEGGAAEALDLLVRTDWVRVARAGCSLSILNIRTASIWRRVLPVMPFPCTGAYPACSCLAVMSLLTVLQDRPPLSPCWPEDESFADVHSTGMYSLYLSSPPLAVPLLMPSRARLALQVSLPRFTPSSPPAGTSFSAVHSLRGRPGAEELALAQCSRGFFSRSTRYVPTHTGPCAGCAYAAQVRFRVVSEDEYMQVGLIRLSLYVRDTDAQADRATL
jgi:hypothetical protein